LEDQAGGGGSDGVRWEGREGGGAPGERLGKGKAAKGGYRRSRMQTHHMEIQKASAVLEASKSSRSRSGRGRNMIGRFGRSRNGRNRTGRFGSSDLMSRKLE